MKGCLNTLFLPIVSSESNTLEFIYSPIGQFAEIICLNSFSYFVFLNICCVVFSVPPAVHVLLHSVPSAIHVLLHNVPPSVHVLLDSVSPDQCTLSGVRSLAQCTNGPSYAERCSVDSTVYHRLIVR